MLPDHFGVYLGVKFLFACSFLHDLLETKKHLSKFWGQFRMVWILSHVASVFFGLLDVRKSWACFDLIRLRSEKEA